MSKNKKKHKKEGHEQTNKTAMLVNKEDIYDDLPDITIIIKPDGDSAAKFTLPPVPMALHFGMYEEAEMILRAMKGPIPVEAFSGRYQRYCQETGEDEEYPELADRIAIGEILIADSSIPKSCAGST